MIIETDNLNKMYRAEAVETTTPDDVNLRFDDGEYYSTTGGPGRRRQPVQIHLVDSIDTFSGCACNFPCPDLAIRMVMDLEEYATMTERLIHLQVGKDVSEKLTEAAYV